MNTPAIRGALRCVILPASRRVPFSTLSSIPPHSSHSGSTHSHAPSGTSIRSLLFFATPIALTFSLGVWQIQRLNRKLRLVEEREASLSAPPLEASALSNPLESLNHRRIDLSGRFLHQCEMLVGPRSAPKDLPTPVQQWGGSSGLQVITPFELDSGHVVLINRGWVPQRLATPAKRATAPVSPHTFITRFDEGTSVIEYQDGSAKSERCCLEGVVRHGDEKNRFTPENDAQRGKWYYVEPRTMMQAAGVEEGPDVVVELLEPLPKGGWPCPRGYNEFLTFRTPPSTHVTYATTWFGLSAALALLTRNRLKQSARRSAK